MSKKRYACAGCADTEAPPCVVGADLCGRGARSAGTSPATPSVREVQQAFTRIAAYLQQFVTADYSGSPHDDVLLVARFLRGSR